MTTSAASGPIGTQRDVVVDGVRLHVAEAGDGPPLLLVHGLAASHAIWAPVMRALSTRWRVIAPDLPGHGASAKPDAAYTIDYHAGVLRSLGRVLGLDAVCVVGSSLGGRIAIQLGADHPDWVHALALAAPAGGYAAWMAPAWAAVSLLASPWVMRTALLRGLDRAFYDPTGDGPAARRRILDESLAAGDFPEHVRAVVRSIAGALTADDTASARLRQPVLLAWGRQDRLVPFAHGAALLRQVPHARLHVFERCGHIPMLEHPEPFVGVLREFLESAAAPGHRRAAGGG